MPANGRRDLIRRLKLILGTRFQNRIFSALVVTFIKGRGVFNFYIHPKYCREKCCIFFPSTLSNNMTEIIINDAGYYWIKIVCVRHVDVAECC